MQQHIEPFMRGEEHGGGRPNPCVRGKISGEKLSLAWVSLQFCERRFALPNVTPQQNDLMSERGKLAGGLESNSAVSAANKNFFYTFSSLWFFLNLSNCLFTAKFA